ncbi:CAP domain-containing protein [Nocardia vulneris]|uniref:CAP domain-containing protein n=1 Tax=Nocardia vulneris TaxID=1141657 RepID=UPI0009E40497|nr:CAP domain-containing protein [Nocardia vulneris]
MGKHSAPRKNRFSPATMLTLSTAFGVSAFAVTIAGTSRAAAAPESGSPAEQVIGLTNAARAEAGCSDLKADKKLTAAAQAHTKDMADNGFLDHNSSKGDPGDRIKAAGYQAQGWAENIAEGQTSASEVVDAWMNSEGHRANILDCKLQDIGVGYAQSSNGTAYWTQDFGTSGGSGKDKDDKGKDDKGDKGKDKEKDKEKDKGKPPGGDKDKPSGGDQKPSDGDKDKPGSDDEAPTGEDSSTEAGDDGFGDTSDEGSDPSSGDEGDGFGEDSSTEDDTEAFEDPWSEGSDESSGDPWSADAGDATQDSDDSSFDPWSNGFDDFAEDGATPDSGDSFDPWSNGFDDGLGGLTGGGDAYGGLGDIFGEFGDEFGGLGDALGGLGAVGDALGGLTTGGPGGAW